MTTSDEQPTLGYWDIRGLAEPIRMLLSYTKTKYHDQVYVQGDGPAFDRSAWTSVKDTVGLDFPNLPYYIDGNIKLTQSNAILRYIATQHNLIGTSVEERAKVLELQDVAMDVRNAAVRVFYTPRDSFDLTRRAYLEEKLPSILRALERSLEKTVTWFGGGPGLSFVDFVFFELLDQHLSFDSTCLSQCPRLSKFHAQVLELPELVGYFKTQYHTRKINNKSASFQ